MNDSSAADPVRVEVVQHQPLVLHALAEAARQLEVTGVDRLDHAVHRRTGQLAELLVGEPSLGHADLLGVGVGQNLTARVAQRVEHAHDDHRACRAAFPRWPRATMIEAFRVTADAHPDRVAVRTPDDSVSYTFAELRERAERLAARAARPRPAARRHARDHAGRTGPSSTSCDLAALCVGATPFSIYNTSAPEQIEYLFGDAGARIALDRAPVRRAAARRARRGHAARDDRPARRRAGGEPARTASSRSRRPRPPPTAPSTSRRRSPRSSPTTC